MPTINQITPIDTIENGDSFLVYSVVNGDARRAAASVVLQYIEENISITSQDLSPVTQYAVPTASGFNINVNDNSNNTHLILTPTATFAAGTITLPFAGNAIDKQILIVNCTQIVTNFTVDANSATAVLGAPTSLAANDFFTLKFDAAIKVWYRIG